MFPGMQGPPPPPPRPYHGRFAWAVNVYNDPFYWSLVKSFTGFFGGVLVLRTIASELAAEQLPGV